MRADGASGSPTSLRQKSIPAKKAWATVWEPYCRLNFQCSIYKPLRRGQVPPTTSSPWAGDDVGPHLCTRLPAGGLMSANPIHGKTIRWTFSDGPMAKKTFEHTFEKDGTVTFREITGGTEGKPSRAEKSEIATVGEDVYAVSYL